MRRSCVSSEGAHSPLGSAVYKQVIGIYTLLFMYAKKTEDMCLSYLILFQVSTLVPNSDETGSSILSDSLTLTY